MAANKTQPEATDVTEYLNNVEPEKKRQDAFALVDLMKDITGYEPVMWGSSIVGFGSYHYVYESGREGDAIITGFAPRKSALTLYIMSGFEEYDDLLEKLGKHKTGKACLYVKKLDDVDMDVLRELIQRSVAHVNETFEVNAN
ncbi:MAG: DUF1801 domain-containing protein [Chloroflexi bacterium]|nr:DUF1801 domain-containing protein [Chloroflexota bacterium]